MRFTLFAFFAFLTLSVAFAGPVTFGTGNPNLDNVIWHSSCGGCTDGPAQTVIGHDQLNNILVDFTDTDSPIIQLYASGATQLTCQLCTNTSIGFENLNISDPGYAFTEIMFQLTEQSTATNGSVTFTAHTTSGNYSSSPMTVAHQGGGQNQFDIFVNTPGVQILSLDVSNNMILHDISQVAMTITSAPEPGSIVLMGAGLVALGGLALRRKKSIA